jgi:hypothetical protein
MVSIVLIVAISLYIYPILSHPHSSNLTLPFVLQSRRPLLAFEPYRVPHRAPSRAVTCSDISPRPFFIVSIS